MVRVSCGATSTTGHDASPREHLLQVIDPQTNAENRRAAIRAAIRRWRSFGGAAALCLLALLVMPLPAHADKVRDLVQVAGVRWKKFAEDEPVATPCAIAHDLTSCGLRG